MPVFIDTLDRNQPFEKFGERYGSYPVLRVHDHHGRDIAGRLDGNAVRGLIPVEEVLEQLETGAKQELGRQNEVLVLGMIHSKHRTSERYSLDVVTEVVRSIDPDYILIEVPPNRFGAAMQDLETLGRVEEPRTKRFPEYVDAIFPLMKELGFELIPTAGWTKSMSDFRSNKMAALRDDPAWAERYAEMDAADVASNAAIAGLGESDDPRVIHTDAYDEAYEISLAAYNKHFNEVLGPGGWDNINAAHYANIERALDAHTGEGKRFLITYGAGHKGWFLRQLRQRRDIVLLNPTDFLR